MKLIIIALTFFTLLSDRAKAQMQTGPTYTIPKVVTTFKAHIWYCDTTYVRYGRDKQCWQDIGYAEMGGDIWFPVFYDRNKKKLNKNFIVYFWVMR